MGTVFIICHWLAVAWYILSKIEMYYGLPHTWLSDFQYDQLPWLEQYVQLN